MTLYLEHLSAAYDRQLVLRDLTLSAHKGEVLGVIGANGAGKSTLLRVIAGTLAPRSGSVRLDGLDLLKLDVRRRAQRLAVVPQNPRVPEAFRVEEIVLMGRTPYLSLLGKESAEDIRLARLAMMQTDTLAFANRRVGELSGGEQQRVLVARALAQQPQVLLLDEATAHLDLKHQAEVLGLARTMAHECGLIVVAALHDLNLAALYADRLALLCAGELLAVDKPVAVLTVPLLQRAYGVRVNIGEHPLYHTPLVALSPEGLA